MHRQRGTKAKAFSPFSSGEELDPKVHTFNHNKTKDCWLIIFGKVYDVTPFMDIDHPEGGEKFCFQQPGRMSQMISKMWVTATESSKNEVEAGKGFLSWSEEVDGGDS
ncbi:hypothetical protein Goari_024677, partial [Gossypium aridum]|nr:hypothetical protein [Gossypium aridum]